MEILVTVLGAVAVVIGLLGLVMPQSITALVENYWSHSTRFRLAVIARFVIGTLLFVIAPECRLPLVVQILGAVTVAAAVVLIFVGQKRLDSFIAWWLARRRLIRTSAVFAVIFGSLLVYAGA